MNGQTSLELLGVMVTLALLLAAGLALLADFPKTTELSLEPATFVLEHGVNLGLPFSTIYPVERFEVVDFNMRSGNESAIVVNVHEGTLEGNRYETFKRH